VTSAADGIRLNVGCGPSGIPGWVNLDNSISVRLARIPGALKALASVGLVGSPSLKYSQAVREFDIQYGNAQHLPFKSDSVEVLYSSHMLEHLGRGEARSFLVEGLRVLVPGGIIRLVVPDLRMRAQAYMATGDADAFINSLLMHDQARRTVREKMAFLVLGSRGHQWMYDAASLSALLESCGFLNARSIKAGETAIPNPGALDLRERMDESIYIEALKPLRSGS